VAPLPSNQVGTEITHYTYWPTGLLKLVTLPDSSTVLYTYDTAHRLSQITDTAGNYVVYSYDLMSNRTGEEAFDSSGVAHRNHTRQFNTLSQLSADINAANTSAVTTSYLYDSQGNLTNVNAPLTRNTIKGYDALNRLSKITDPNSGITYLGYDANDNLASVEDPRAFTTSYNHNGFNDLTQVVSPDTGTKMYAYDSGGNPKTITDARGAAANLSFDDANRLTKIVYSDQTINYGYDSGTNGVGHLTSASDANHSMSWTYDTLGRVSGKGQTVGSVTKSVGYSYTNSDLITLVTPSGQNIVYGYNNHRITSIQVGSTTLLSGVTYDPFGPATGWTWGNGTTTSKSFDMDGNPSQIVTAGVTNIYSVDDASRITQLTDGGLSSNTWNFTAYDALDRIKTANSSGKTRGYTYDANGNIQAISGTTTLTEAVSATNNQLTATSGAIARTYAYDLAGNASYTGETYTFNQRGRMSVAVSSAGTTNYVYNALGQLIEKSGNGGTTLLVYDEVGHILGEYTSAGALVQETVWMGDTPVATLRPNGTSVSIYYVHTDHLGTPRKVTRPSDNGLMWRYDPDTYGSSGTAVNGNPAGLGTFVYNLRFPGQYFLSESGLSYNYFRTYDPAVGRYIESDPMGLAGGSYATYSYVRNNPISNKDPLGLMCTPGIGCYTTPAESALAQSGNYLGYYQLACAGGDAYACFAQHVAANDSYLGQLATDRVLDALHKKGSSCDDKATLNQIRTDLANDYASYLPSDPADARWPSASDIASFHADEFAKFGLPASTFGGTPLGSWGGLFGASIWCPNCGGPRPPFAGMH
jgi:RHS repeat-associated protein